MLAYTILSQRMPNLLWGRQTAVELERVIAETGGGPDYVAGETVLGMFRDHSEYRGTHHTCSFIFTDRRTFGALRRTGAPSTPFDIAHDDVIAAREDGVLGAKLVVQLRSRVVELKHHVASRALLPFFQALAMVHPDTRRPCATVRSPLARDPLAAQTTRASLVAQDPRPSTVIARAVDAHACGGASVDVAKNLVERAYLLDRFLRTGRGKTAGRWLSVLRRDALRGVLSAAFGPPMRGGALPTGEFLDFPVTASGGSSALSNAAGLAALAVLGVGWVSRSSGPPLTAIRADLVDLPCGSGFGLFGARGPQWVDLAEMRPTAVEKLSRAVVEYEADALAREAAQYSRAVRPLTLRSCE